MGNQLEALALQGEYISRQAKEINMLYEQLFKEKEQTRLLSAQFEGNQPWHKFMEFLLSNDGQYLPIAFNHFVDELLHEKTTELVREALIALNARYAEEQNVGMSIYLEREGSPILEITILDKHGEALLKGDVEASSFIDAMNEVKRG